MIFVVFYIFLVYFVQFLFLVSFYRNFSRPLFLFLTIISLVSNGILLCCNILPRVFQGFSTSIVESNSFINILYHVMLAWLYPFMVLTLPYAFLYGVFGIIFFMNYKKSKKIKETSLNTKECIDSNSNEISRRKFFSNIFYKGFLSTPIFFSTTVFSGFFLGSRDIVTISKNIPINELHPDLEGLKIVQISDIHVGTLIHEQYLDHVIQLLKTIHADILVVTGDIVDNSNIFLGILQKFFFRVKKFYPMGIYAVTGNHDLIDNGEQLVQELTSVGVNFLDRNSVILSQGKGFINLAGLPFPPLRFRRKRAEFAEIYLQETQQKIQKQYPTILLNHHPSDFQMIQNYPIDLTLSGHTHGGQIHVGFNRDTNLNPVALMYKYYVDLYQENKHQYLYVNRGLGHWFPLRINCPPEITVIELSALKNN